MVELTARVPDTVVASLVALPRVALPNTSKVPDTSRPPFISTFPLAELITRSPV